MKYILALDQGTTSSRTVVFDETMRVAAQHAIETTQHYPRTGWVEHDPAEILSTQLASMRQAMALAGIGWSDVAAIGITNQRETTLVWDRATGQAIHPAIVWQCRRTANICERLTREGLAGHIRNTTGLVIDAYFSGTKLAWILDHVDGARERARRGELLFGTVDSWLVWHLTNGAAHVTDVTNASRTMLYDIHKLCYDDTILQALDIPAGMLPRVMDSSAIYGHYEVDGHRIPIAGIAGDQQASLFGHGCFEPGQAKNTYGTGCFLLMNTGETAHNSQAGLITTIAVGLGGRVQYALEGSVFVAGAVVQWLRDELGLITDSAHMSQIAASVPDTGGVYLVPAFTGLGAPHWDMYARGCLVGLTRGTNRAHIVRAANESIAYGVSDLVHAMKRDSSIDLSVLNADGGACRDEFLMQFQADILGLPVQRTAVLETTALGAAWLAGLAVGVYDLHSGIHAKGTRFEPSMDDTTRSALCGGWRRAVERSLRWEEA